MGSDGTEAIEALLAETEQAHGKYETTELNGVYDREWPRWYAEYAVANGIGEVLGRPVSAEELARFLASSWDERQGNDAGDPEPWTAYTARQIATEL